MKRAIALALLAALALAIAMPFATGVTARKEKEVTPLKEAKLIIEHNATDGGTGFQLFVDSDGWRSLAMRGPRGQVLSFEARGNLGKLGLTELFLETVEPANADVPIDEVLEALPAGRYEISGSGMEAGESTGRTAGVALLSHDIPAGPELLSPAEGASVPVNGVVLSWGKVAETITGAPVSIIVYQLIVQKQEDPHPHMIGGFGLSLYLPPHVNSITLPDGFLEPGATYAWEVLAIEESGNQTLSSGEFETN
jgi:hypothetical protein